MNLQGHQDSYKQKERKDVLKRPIGKCPAKVQHQQDADSCIYSPSLADLRRTWSILASLAGSPWHPPPREHCGNE